MQRSAFNAFADLPAGPGSYALHLVLPAPLSLSIGKMGRFVFPTGDYIYLGSARIAHHARVADYPHWHLDWLRPHAILSGVWYATGAEPLECSWSQAMLRLPGAIVPAPGFGAADCHHRCPAHLVAFPAGTSLAGIEACLMNLPLASLSPESPAFGDSGERDGRE